MKHVYDMYRRRQSLDGPICSGYGPTVACEMLHAEYLKVRAAPRTPTTLLAKVLAHGLRQGQQCTRHWPCDGSNNSQRMHLTGL